jgi:hypothetical protein
LLVGCCRLPGSRRRRVLAILVYNRTSTRTPTEEMSSRVKGMGYKEVMLGKVLIPKNGIVKELEAKYPDSLTKVEEEKVQIIAANELGYGVLISLVDLSTSQGKVSFHVIIRSSKSTNYPNGNIVAAYKS